MSTEAHRTSRHPLLRKLVSAHRTTAGVLFNTLLLFVAVNLALWAADAWHDHRQEANPLLVHPKEWLAVAFPGWSHADLKAMLDEHIGGFSYDDYVMFKKTPVRRRYVNVSENGFRVSRAQGPWPPSPTNFNVFVFGGSTTFGLWVPDEQTVPSFLQAALARQLATNVCVYNFGTPYYYSTQERLRFERLLGQGIVPNAAVFVDGTTISPDWTTRRSTGNCSSKQLKWPTKRRACSPRWSRSCRSRASSGPSLFASGCRFGPTRPRCRPRPRVSSRPTAKIN
jgi:hypothetical protein